MIFVRSVFLEFIFRATVIDNLSYVPFGASRQKSKFSKEPVARLAMHT